MHDYNDYKIRDVDKKDNIAPMKINFSNTRREATIDLPPVRVMHDTVGDVSPHLVRFVINFDSLHGSEKKDFKPFVIGTNAQVIVFDQPANAVAVKCSLYDWEGNGLDSETLPPNDIFDAGTTVTSPGYARGMVCIAFYFDPLPADILRYFKNYK